MTKNIEIPEPLFNRLAKHASGFDTPANVITRILDLYESSFLKPDTNIIMDAFQKVFNVEPRSFGLKTSIFNGYSDDRNGVQWNIIVNRETGQVNLGVNLEGMKYKNWPITNLLLKERDNSKLVELTDIEGAESINFKMTRDAWQAAARPEIAERCISQENLKLADLTYSQWMSIIDESLACLDEVSGYRKRGIQTVYLTKSKIKKEMPTSPHLGFSLEVSKKSPTDIDTFIEAIEKAKALLMPLYRFTQERSS
jgi:hypothetical protein